MLRGTGLGLALVNRAVELHDSHIVAESEEGRGTTVTVTFPLSTSFRCKTL